MDILSFLLGDGGGGNFEAKQVYVEAFYNAENFSEKTFSVPFEPAVIIAANYGGFTSYANSTSYTCGLYMKPTQIGSTWYKITTLNRTNGGALTNQQNVFSYSGGIVTMTMPASVSCAGGNWAFVFIGE